MSKSKEIGYIEEKQALEGKRIAWKIYNFTSVTIEGDFDFYKSPAFNFENDLWSLNIWRLKPMYPEIIFLCLISENARDYSVEYSFDLETTDKNMLHLDTGILEGGKLHKPPSDFFKLSEVLERKSEVLPSDSLTIVCTMKLFSELSLHSTPLRKSCYKKMINDRSLCEDYKRIFRSGQNHDLILKFGDKEFPVHRDILRIRAPVFESKLSHIMKEKDNNIVDVPDCDPHAMEQFILYAYCGTIEALDESIMLELYNVADKYDMTPLKEECCDFIKQSLCATNVCEIIQIALNHSDSSLLEYATKYFSNNLTDILRTTEWQSFMKDNSTIANDLLIKSVDSFKKVKI